MVTTNASNNAMKNKPENSKIESKTSEKKVQVMGVEEKAALKLTEQ